MKIYQARIMVLFSALLFSAGGLVAKIVTFSPLTLVFFRGITGIPVMLLYIYFFKCKDTTLINSVRSSFNSSRKRRSMLMGITAYSIAGLTLFLSFRLTTAANATLFQQTSPIWVAVLGFVFLGERASLKHILSIVIVMFGIFLCMAGNFDASGTRGNILALVSGLSFAILVIAMRLMDEKSSLIALSIGMLIMVIVSTPSFIGDYKDSALAGKHVILALSMGLVQFAMPFIMYNRALLWMNAVESTILRLLEPVLTTIWVAVLVGELPGRNTIVGGGIVLAVLVYLVFENNKEPAETVDERKKIP